MKVLYVGSIVPEEYCLEIKDSSLAGNKLQVNLINELRKNCDVDILSFICVPLTEDQQMKIDNYNLNNTDKYYYKGSHFILNLFLYRRKIRKISKNYDVVMTFNVNYPWLGLPKLAKCGESSLILSDFSDTNSFTNILLKLYAFICKLDFKKYSSIIYLSKMHKKYIKDTQRSVYIPGGIKGDSFKNVKLSNFNKKITLMYSGFLGQVTGIDMLIDAFNDSRFDNCDLIITGRGDFSNDIKKLKQKNIHFLGSLEENEYIKTLNGANILVNPRNMNLPENQNNFPSKIFDYLSVGKVLVSTKFSGYEDFKDNFYFCESNVEDLKEKLLCAINEYEKKYKKFFLLNTTAAKNYTWEKQVKKILDILKG